MIDELHTPLRILSAQADQIAESDCACAPPAGPPALSSNLIITASNADAGRAESDCACATADWSAVGSGGSAPTWHRPDDLYLAPLPAGHTLAFNPKHPGPVAVLNPLARRLLDSFGAPGPLERAGAVLPTTAPAEAICGACQLAELGLLAPFPNPQSPIPNPQSTLTAWLHLTNACNLRCAYCYVAKSGEGMDEAIGRAAVDAVFRSAVGHGYRGVKLKYAGANRPSTSGWCARYMNTPWRWQIAMGWLCKRSC